MNSFMSVNLGIDDLDLYNEALEQESLTEKLNAESTLLSLNAVLKDKSAEERQLVISILSDIDPSVSYVKENFNEFSLGVESLLASFLIGSFVGLIYSVYSQSFTHIRRVAEKYKSKPLDTSFFSSTKIFVMKEKGVSRALTGLENIAKAISAAAKNPNSFDPERLNKDFETVGIKLLKNNKGGYSIVNNWSNVRSESINWVSNLDSGGWNESNLKSALDRIVKSIQDLESSKTAASSNEKEAVDPLKKQGIKQVINAYCLGLKQIGIMLISPIVKFYDI